MTPIVYIVAEVGQVDFDVPFPFIHVDHVEVRANGIRWYPTEWVNSARLRLSAPPGAGAFVELRRNTPIGAQFVQFQNGAILTEEDLNLAVRQILYKQQELAALYENTLLAARVRIGEAGGVAVTPEDAANQIASLVAEQQVLDDFRQRIADIDINSAQLFQHSTELADVTASTGTLSGLLDDLRSDHDTLSGLVDSLANLEDGTGLATIIQSEADARITGDTALAAVLALIGAKSGDNSAFILDLNKVKVSPTESISQRFSALSTKDDQNSAAIQAESSARTTAISAEAAARNSLAATLRGETAASVEGERLARTTAISAEASARTNLAATLRGETTASVSQEASARANADGIFTGLFSLLGAKNAQGTAFILADDRVQLANGIALGTRLSGIDATIGGVNAAVVNEQNARASGDQANANLISVVSTNLNGLTSTVSTLSSSVNGLGARWGVELNVNGYVSGIILNNAGGRSDFTVLADKFRVINPVNGNLLQPFVVEGGVVKVTALFAGTINADQINTGRLNVGSLIWDGDIWTSKLAANAATQAAWATLSSTVTLTNFTTNRFLQLSVPNVVAGELLKISALVSLYSSNDLSGMLSIIHTLPNGQEAFIYSQDMKLDSDGNTATYIPLPAHTRIAATQSGTHTFTLSYYPVTSATYQARSGSDIEVTRIKR